MNKENLKSIPKIYANCKLTKGIKRSTITDLIKNSVHLIPNDLCDILTTHIDKDIDSIKKFYNNRFDKIIDEYFTHLDEIGVLMYTNKPQNFPGISDNWNIPMRITNIIIDLVPSSTFDITIYLKQIEDLHCKNIQFRFFYSPEITDLKNILSIIDAQNSIITSIDIIVLYNESYKLNEIEDLFNKYIRLTNFFIYSYPNTEWEELYINDKQTLVLCSHLIISHLSCGTINSRHFVPNMFHYTESLAHNTCLNRKIAIDAEGNIKNCPSMKESFGNIKDTTLEEAINKPGFKKYWNITKDQITKCKDCEFRHVCTDCRAYIDNPNDIYSAPLKCGYDPYTCEWEEWSTNSLKQKAIDFYGMREIL